MLSIARRLMCAATIVTLLGMVETCARAAEPVAGEAISFELDIMPILTARGCNAGACHGKQRGQNGFQLSLLGFDAEFDFVALTREGRGRRVFPADSERSLLLRKGAARMPQSMLNIWRQLRQVSSMPTGGRCDLIFKSDICCINIDIGCRGC